MLHFTIKITGSNYRGERDKESERVDRERKIGHKWSQMFANSRNWSQMIENYRNGRKRSQMVEIGHKWLQIVAMVEIVETFEIGRKWLQMITIIL